MGPQKVIINVDTGVDDAWALLILLQAKKKQKIEILAILCSAGNALLENVCINTCRVLQSENEKTIPVYRGIDIKRRSSECDFFGTDGFCDVPFDNMPDMSQVKPDDGIQILEQLITAYKGEIILFCVGPLTDVGESMKKYSCVISDLKEIFIMGGDYSEDQNTSGTAEYNFLADPENANMVLSNAKCSITLLPWETCVKVNTSLEWRFNIFKNSTNRTIQMLNKLEKICWKDEPMSGTWNMCDFFLACILIDRKVIQKSLHTRVTVETLKNNQYGKVIIANNREKNVEIVTDLNSKLIEEILLHLADSHS